MKKALVVLVLAGLAFVQAPRLLAQFTAEELAQRPQWEEFLKTAKVIKEEQMTGREAVTSPWVLTLQLGDVTHKALWKNAQGRMQGYVEGWQYEIAAYLLDKELGLNMVPPTVERRVVNEDKGSCQWWIDDTMTLLAQQEKNIKTPPRFVFTKNRMTYLQRFFDNLIANEDRHLNQILVTKDWRYFFIDHSRSFRSSGNFTKKLIYTERHPEGPKLMSELPRALVEKTKGLTEESIKAAVGEYLTEAEIKAVLARRDLILAEIDKLIKKNGEAAVLY